MKELITRFQNKQAKIVVIGLGYVGLPLAIVMAESGFRVTGIDKDKGVIANLEREEKSISDVDSWRLRKALESENLFLTLNFAEAKNSDAIIICVPTPLTKYREPNTNYILEATDAILPYLSQGHLLVLESTSYPGTTEELIKPRLEAKGFEIGKDIYLAYSPERIDPGSKRYGLQNIPKVVGGVTKNCTEVAKSLYEQVIQSKVHTVSSPKVAEMGKLLENIFRNVNIALVNELTQLCDRMDIDIWEVIEAAESKPYGFMPFYPGPGVGGHCIPVDPFYLSWKARESEFQVHFIELAGEINANMPAFVVLKLNRILNRQQKHLNGAKILLLGVAYKRDIADTRESPALKLITLLERESAEVVYHDPYVHKVIVDENLYESVELTQETLQSMDAVLIVTDHSVFDYDFIVDHCKLLLDTRNAVKSKRKNVYKI
ncbi:nucleotide sugar dehydrogenase [Thermodesulfovibrionales bacterium]|nr:nucleotide sugar dehydrogenase [Thermodesulfovibrionales bacterium]